jgi:hypothetical protein
VFLPGVFCSAFVFVAMRHAPVKTATVWSYAPLCWWQT